MRKVLIALFVLMAAESCSKKESETDNPGDKPDTPVVTVPDTVNLISKAYYYTASSLDTSGSYTYVDTFYYNSDLKIEKIVSQENANDSVVSKYTYNSAGKISKLSVANNFGNDFTNFELLFYYDSKDRLDSMVNKRDNEVIAYKFTYDAKDRVTHEFSYLLKAYYADYQDGDINAEEHYYWNSNGTLDSVNTGLYTATSRDQIFDVHTLAMPAGNAVLPANAIDPSYLLKLAWQNYSYFLSQYINVYWHQYLNQGVDVLRNGTMNYTFLYDDSRNYYGHDYNIKTVMNVDNTVRWLFATQVTRNGLTRNNGMNKLEYIRIVKQ